MSLSSNARAVLAWCETHQSTATRTIAGKTCPVVSLNWNGLAAAQGFDSDASPGATRASLDSLDELRAAGLLARYDEGPECYGHSTLCFVPQG